MYVQKTDCCIVKVTQNVSENDGQLIKNCIEKTDYFILKDT